MSRRLMLTGRPGVGKTTLVEQVCDALSDANVAGFVTREMRERGERVGFVLVPFNAARRPMAHRDFVSNHRVGRYGVDVESIDYVVDTALSAELSPELWVVDEIGKMEMLSRRFVTAMKRLLASPTPLLATVSLSDGLAEAWPPSPASSCGRSRARTATGWSSKPCAGWPSDGVEARRGRRAGQPSGQLRSLLTSFE